MVLTTNWLMIAPPRFKDGGGIGGSGAGAISDEGADRRGSGLGSDRGAGSVTGSLANFEPNKDPREIEEEKTCHDDFDMLMLRSSRDSFVSQACVHYFCFLDVLHLPRR
jgi:hypothetical protein